MAKSKQGRGNTGRNPGRGGRGRGGRIPPTTVKSTDKVQRHIPALSFVTEPSINTKLPVSNKQGSDQRSPMEGGTEKKKATAAPASTTTTSTSSW